MRTALYLGIVWILVIPSSLYAWAVWKSRRDDKRRAQQDPMQFI